MRKPRKAYFSLSTSASVIVMRFAFFDIFPIAAMSFVAASAVSVSGMEENQVKVTLSPFTVKSVVSVPSAFYMSLPFDSRIFESFSVSTEVSGREIERPVASVAGSVAASVAGACSSSG